MPTYRVTDPKTGRTLRLTGDSPPTEQELEQIFAAQAPADEPSAPQGPPAGPTIGPREVGIFDRVAEAIPREGIPGVVMGAAKEAGNAVRAGGDMLRAGWNAVAPGERFDMERPYQHSGPTPATTPYERLGMAGVRGAEIVGGVKAGVSAIRSVPEMVRRGIGASTTRAAGKLEDVARLANKEPMPVNADFGRPLTEILELERAGGRMPKPVKNLIDRLTDPDLDPITFEEGRRFYQNISRLSAKDAGRMTPVMRREVTKLREIMHNALTQTADDAAGMGDIYESGIKEYGRGARLSATAKAFGKEAGKDTARVVGVGALAKYLGLID